MEGSENAEGLVLSFPRRVTASFFVEVDTYMRTCARVKASRTRF